MKPGAKSKPHLKQVAVASLSLGFITQKTGTRPFLPTISPQSLLVPGVMLALEIQQWVMHRTCLTSMPPSTKELTDAGEQTSKVWGSGKGWRKLQNQERLP